MHLVKLSFIALWLTACATETTHPATTVTAHWTLGDLATGRTLGCPAGFPIARVIAQPIDGGDAIVTDFDCAAGLGVTAALAPAPYALVVQIIAADGTAFAQATPRTIDLTDGNDARLDATILEDAGYAQLAWTLVDAASGAALTCAAAVIDHLVVTGTGPAGTFEDAFGCDGPGGLTSALPAGDYTFAVAATRLGQTVGTASAPERASIAAPNRITDLGSIPIPVTVP